MFIAMRDDAEGEPFRVLAGPAGSIQGPAEAKWGYTTLSVADWDGDHDPDIIYNSILSRVGLLRNDGGKLIDVTFDSGQNETPPKLVLVADQSQQHVDSVANNAGRCRLRRRWIDGLGDARSRRVSYFTSIR